MPDTQPALHTWHLLSLVTFLSPRATLSVLSPLLHHQKRAELTWKMWGTWEHRAAMVLRVGLQRGEAEVKHSCFQMTYLFGGGVEEELSFSFFWNLVLFEVASHSWNSSHRYSETSQPPSWKEAQLLSHLRPNKNRAGPRPLDTRGQALPCRTWNLSFLREENYTVVRASLPHLKEWEGIFRSVSSLRRLWGPWWGQLSPGKPLKRDPKIQKSQPCLLGMAMTPYASSSGGWILKRTGPGT